MKSIGEKLSAMASAIASIGRKGGVSEELMLKGRYEFKCTAPVEEQRERYIELRDQMLDLGYELSGTTGLFSRADFQPEHLPLLDEYSAIPLYEKWNDTIKNTVVTQGKNDLLDKYLAGSSYTAAFYLSLIAATGYVAIAAADTAAQINGTNQWKEAAIAQSPTYSQATRPAPSWSAAAAGSKTTSAVVAFSITNVASATAKGAFLVTSSTKDGTAGVLFSAGLFTQGDRAVINGDTINATYTLGV